MVSRERSTLEGHAVCILQRVKNCALIVSKMPAIDARGLMPLGDLVGMGVTVELLVHSLTSRPRIKGQKFVQFDSVRMTRTSVTITWQSSLHGILEGSAFSEGFGKTMLTACPMQQKWFRMFLQGVELHTGIATQANRALDIKVVVRVLELVKSDIEDLPINIARELFKFGAAIAVTQCA